MKPILLGPVRSLLSVFLTACSWPLETTHWPVDSFEELRCGEKSEKRQETAHLCYYTYLHGSTWKYSYLKPDHQHPPYCVLAPRTCFPINTFQAIPKLFLSFILQHPPAMVCYRHFFLFKEVCSLLLTGSLTFSPVKCHHKAWTHEIFLWFHPL